VDGEKQGLPGARIVPVRSAASRARRGLPHAPRTPVRRADSGVRRGLRYKARTAMRDAAGTGSSGEAGLPASDLDVAVREGADDGKHPRHLPPPMCGGAPGLVERELARALLPLAACDSSSKPHTSTRRPRPASIRGVAAVLSGFYALAPPRAPARRQGGPDQTIRHRGPARRLDMLDGWPPGLSSRAGSRRSGPGGPEGAVALVLLVRRGKKSAAERSAFGRDLEGR
jgi:hypothetical protein